MTKKSHYPTYDVMTHKHEWDGHTQSIVTRRLIREHRYAFLQLYEAEMLRRICALLVDDSRNEIIQYAIGHIDQTLSQSVGESERKPVVPKASVLVRQGLSAVERMSRTLYLKPFVHLEEADQKQILTDLSQGSAKLLADDRQLPQKPLFNKLLTLTVEAYCSHPKVWSEIGYGGPAYPRGYVRTGIGQLDPWEAKQEK